MRARVLTLNLAGLGHGWFEGRSEAAIQGLNALAPDVVCLQEATVLYASQLYDQAGAIAEAIGLESVAFTSHGSADEPRDRTHGLAVVSRWSIRRVRERRLYNTHDGRVVLLVRLMAPGGDLNATEEEPVIHLVSKGLADTFRARHPDAPGFTWIRESPYARGWTMPDRRLDDVFCPRGVRVHRAEVVLDRPAPVFPSDDFGVLAELEWEEDSPDDERGAGSA